MKRIATLAATLIPFACAQAQESVTIYGVVDAALSVASGGAGVRTTRIDSGVGPGSRLGFRGREELGNGLYTTFALEMGFNSDAGTLGQGGLAWGRQAFVGIGSDNGWRVTAGRQYSPVLLAMFDADAMQQVYWGNTDGTGIGGQQSPGSGIGAGCQGYSSRINNSVQAAASGNGFTGKLMVGAGDENSQHSGRYMSPSLAYSSGPVTVVAAYSRFRQCAADIPAAAMPDWQSEVVLGGTLDLGVAKLFAGYYDYNPSEANKTLTSTTAKDNRYVWLGTRIPVGGTSTVIAQFTHEVQKQTGPEGKANVLGLTYEYALSKRTRTYVTAAKVWNNATARFGLVAATAVQSATGLGADPRVISFGVTHSF